MTNFYILSLVKYDCVNLRPESEEIVQLMTEFGDVPCLNQLLFSLRNRFLFIFALPLTLQSTFRRMLSTTSS